MTNPFQAVRAGRGALIQSAVPTRPKPADLAKTQGLLFRGVVMSTYEADNPEHPHVTDAASGPNAVYCDVLCYASIPGHRFFLIRGALVTQERSGLHDGDIWKPRPTTKDISGATYNPDVGGSPYNLDGDHVLLGFLDGAYNQPIVLRALPHPQRDVGNAETDPGRKLILRQADGDPRLLRHHGAVFGVTANGDFLIDLEKANDGTTQDKGAPTDPTQDGTAGNCRVRLQVGAKLVIEMEGGEVLTIEEQDGAAKLKLGDGAQSALLAEAFQTFWDNNFGTAIYNVHTHATPVGPSGPPLVPAPTLPATVISTKVKIPNNG